MVRILGTYSGRVAESPAGNPPASPSRHDVPYVLVYGHITQHITHMSASGRVFGGAEHYGNTHFAIKQFLICET